MIYPPPPPLTPLQKLFIKMTPIGIWLTPSAKGYKKYGITIRTIHSLVRKGYIDKRRKIGMNYEIGWHTMSIKRII